MRAILFCFVILSGVFAFSQTQKSQDDPRKILHEISVRLYEQKQTEADYQLLQNLHQAASAGTNKRIVLHLAAQYRRKTLENPAQTLETILPHVISKDEFDAGLRNALRHRFACAARLSK